MLYFCPLRRTVAFLVPVTFMMHACWRLHDPAPVHTQSAVFWKNVSMLGGAIMLLNFGGPVSVDAGWSDGDPGKPR